MFVFRRRGKAEGVTCNGFLALSREKAKGCHAMLLCYAVMPCCYAMLLLLCCHAMLLCHAVMLCCYVLLLCYAVMLCCYAMQAISELKAS